jgi:hypothetical protein
MTLVDVDAEVGKSIPPPDVAPQRQASLPNVHTDPFTAREGKTLTWKNINMTLVSFCFMKYVSPFPGFSSHIFLFIYRPLCHS